MRRRTEIRRSPSKRNWQLLGIACLAVLAYFLFSLSDLVVSKHRLDERLSALQSEVTRLEAESKALEQEVEWLRTDQAVEALAREELGWVKPGETGVIVVPSEPTTATEEPQRVKLKTSRVPNWERWWALFFGQ